MENKLIQKSPKPMRSDQRFISLHSICNYPKLISIATAVTKDCVYCLHFNEFKQPKHTNILDYYSNVWQITPYTIDLNKNNKTDLSKIQINFNYESHFIENFDILCELGSGLFGAVYKVKNKINQSITAVKKGKIEGLFVYYKKLI